MSVRVIAIAREFGSGGATIARMLADRLGWRLLDRELVDEVARAANIEPRVVEEFDERCDAWMAALLRAIWQGSGEWPSGLSEADLLDARTMAKLTRPIVEHAAAAGNCVIVGRGAQCILDGHPQTFRAFLYAPLELRKRRVAERVGGVKDLVRHIEEKDAERAAYIHRFFGRQWNDLTLYDLMLNTRCGDETAVETILAAARIAAPVHAAAG
ncbi:MAG: AAA family ATPase [Bryobacteraceae bacterium]